MICSYDFSFVDFPHKYSMVLYFAGCNLRCGFCYNKQVVMSDVSIDIDEIVRLYQEQCDIFNTNIGVVLSGGEPTIASDFEDVYNLFSDSPRAIHTNGLVVPDFNCEFNSVVLSLKSRNEGVGNLDKYALKINRAMEYYINCDYKELRIVKIEENMDDYEYVLNKLLYKDSYNICFVEEVKVNEG